MRKAIVTGYAGFIGTHLVRYLKQKGYWVVGIDIEYPKWESPETNEIYTFDLRLVQLNDFGYLVKLFKDTDEVYHLAADMGGIGYIETHKADIVYNNSLINLHTIKACQEAKVGKFLFTSSACVYPDYLQREDTNILLDEDCAYPADSEDGYGWEKLMMERTCRHFREDYGLQTYIARFHNIYGPLGTFDGGKEKSPAALCRKIAKAKDGDTIEIWGDGKQTRSYCYVDDCVEALYLLMQSDYHEPINIGTDRAVTIDKLADIIARIANKNILKQYNLSAPKGVYNRNADINRIREVLGWQPKVSLEEGLEKTYLWIKEQLS